MPNSADPDQLASSERQGISRFSRTMVNFAHDTTPNLPHHILSNATKPFMPEFTLCWLKHLMWIAEEKYSDWEEGYIYSYYVIKDTIMNKILYLIRLYKSTLAATLIFISIMEK